MAAKKKVAKKATSKKKTSLSVQNIVATTSLEKEVNSLKSEKTTLEREIAEKNAKLEQCAKDKAETQKNLQKMGL